MQNNKTRKSDLCINVPESLRLTHIGLQNSFCFLSPSLFSSLSPPCLGGCQYWAPAFDAPALTSPVSSASIQGLWLRVSHRWIVEHPEFMQPWLNFACSRTCLRTSPWTPECGSVKCSESTSGRRGACGSGGSVDVRFQVS